jgi:hypothetical protein
MKTRHKVILGAAAYLAVSWMIIECREPVPGPIRITPAKNSPRADMTVHDWERGEVKAYEWKGGSYRVMWVRSI